MFTIQQTDVFERWFAALRDQQAKVRILGRLARMEIGNFGDAKPVGEGVSELRIDYGPGYRVYFKRTGQVVVLILCGGDKATQDRDIKQAKALAKEF